jgi:hypothetical protein
MARVREVEYADLDVVAALSRSEGWGAPTVQDWCWLWRENPALEGAPIVARGWVLVDEGQTVVGFLSNVAQAYRLRERRLLAATAAGLIVAPAFRGNSMQLIMAHARQPNVDLLLNTTAAPHVSKIAEFLKFRRMPQKDYDRSFYWVLRPRAFSAAALRKKGLRARVSQSLAMLLSPFLWAENRLRRRGPLDGSYRTMLRTIDAAAAGAEFDDLWQRKLAEGSKLLAVRDSRSLRWHFDGRGRACPPVIVCAYDGSRLVGYVVIVRQDAPHLGLTRARVADLFVERDDPQTIRQLLGGAAAEARRGGAAMLEVVGFPSHVRRVFEALRPFELRNDSWPFLFKATDPAVQKVLAEREMWHACLYDGDGSL